MFPSQITEKQIEQRRVTQTLYIPIKLALEVDSECKRLGVSRSALINRYISEGLSNNIKKLRGVPAHSANTLSTSTTENSNHEVNGGISNG